ncbi:mitogen-activated protein kinase kinase kinase 7-like [Drosophila grimshawi]|uniref:mitogen-activated protein kinase kinase kinase 7-like n=1 Tax=Drosophila grimshawi TaxID=7222 RepID=UPI001C936A13|nr:mitogen-activated protein kinase kinase kinase 7-like [Drosophila grimshawi]
MRTTEEKYYSIHANQMLKQQFAKIGYGSFGVVWKGIYKGDVVAIKQIRGDIEIDTQIKKESDSLANINGHENIVKLFGFSTFDNESYLVMEYMAGGSLAELLHEKTNIKYTLGEGIHWLYQAAQAVAYLRANSVRGAVHRDVQPGNMLLDGERKIIKICDFGCVRKVQTEMSRQGGIPVYLAPEIFNGYAYTEKSDVYSLGITIWEVLVRKIPFEEQVEKSYNIMLLRDIDENDLRPPLKDLTDAECPDDIQTLIQKCWDKDPKKRPSLQGIVDILQLHILKC